MGLPDKVADFTVLPIAYGKSTQHVLYLREHVTKKQVDKVASFPNGRTLFVVNIPPDATERELTLFFKTCGHVERISIQREAWSPDAYGPLEESDDNDDTDEDGGAVPAVRTEADSDTDDSTQRQRKKSLSRKKEKRKAPPPKVVPLPQPEPPLRTFHHSGASAHVVFTDAVSINRALSLASSHSDQRVWPPTSGATAASGLAHYAALHDAQRPPLSAVKAHADTFLEVYEYNKALTRKKAEYRKGEAVVDEDGFTLVTRGGAYGTTLGGGVGVASKRFMKDTASGQAEVPGKRGKKKPKKHEKDGFYKFQLHEQKRKELVDLKAAFEKDKQKIAQLKSSRQFKPY